MKLKKGDTIVVIAGKNKGEQGEIQAVLPKLNKVLIGGLNSAKRHTKARAANQQGGIIDKEVPVDASNVMLVHKGKPTRVGYKIKADGTKVRIAKTTGEEI
jgi:large subunit ribosomal protein L24